MGGYKNRILEVDLSIGKMDITDVSEDDKKRFIGGSGVSAKLFLDRFDIQSNALSPGNPLIIMNGPITGTNLPGTSRFVVCGKSVMKESIPARALREMGTDSGFSTKIVSRF